MTTLNFHLDTQRGLDLKNVLSSSMNHFMSALPNPSVEQRRMLCNQVTIHVKRFALSAFHTLQQSVHNAGYVHSLARLLRCHLDISKPCYRSETHHLRHFSWFLLKSSLFLEK